MREVPVVRGALVVAWKVAVDVWGVQVLLVVRLRARLVAQLVETMLKWVRLSQGWRER